MNRVRTLISVAATLAVLAAGCSEASEPSSKESSSPSASTSPATSDPAEPEDVLAGKSAEEVLEVARKAVTEAPYVSLDGIAVGDDFTVEIHMRYAADKAGGIVADADGEVTLLRGGETTWFKAADSFWRENVENAEAVIAAIGGRWIVASTSKALAPLARLASVEYIPDDLLSKKGERALAEESVVGGTPCRLVVMGEVDVCVSHEDGLPLQVRSYDRQAILDFGYDELFIASAPAPADTVDFGELLDSAEAAA